MIVMAWWSLSVFGDRSEGLTFGVRTDLAGEFSVQGCTALGTSDVWVIYCGY